MGHKYRTYDIELTVVERTTYDDSSDTASGHYHFNADGVPSLNAAVQLASDALRERWPDVQAKLKPVHKQRRRHS